MRTPADSMGYALTLYPLRGVPRRMLRYLRLISSRRKSCVRQRRYRRARRFPSLRCPGLRELVVLSHHPVMASEVLICSGRCFPSCSPYWVRLETLLKPHSLSRQLWKGRRVLSTLPNRILNLPPTCRRLADPTLPFGRKRWDLRLTLFLPTECGDTRSHPGTRLHLLISLTAVSCSNGNLTRMGVSTSIRYGSQLVAAFRPSVSATKTYLPLRVRWCLFVLSSCLVCTMD